MAPEKATSPCMWRSLGRALGPRPASEHTTDRDEQLGSTTVAQHLAHESRLFLLPSLNRAW